MCPVYTLLYCVVHWTVCLCQVHGARWHGSHNLRRVAQIGCGFGSARLQEALTGCLPRAIALMETHITDAGCIADGLGYIANIASADASKASGIMIVIGGGGVAVEAGTGEGLLVG